jgi:hypothetical protein
MNLNNNRFQKFEADYTVSIKEHISRVLWNSNIFDFCRFVAYCGTNRKTEVM